MSEFKGDYMGFTYNGIHSSTLGIVRISDGSRFNENLLPTIQDKTVQVPGGDGTYFFGSYYTQRQFNIPFAFDSLTEEQLNRVKSLFGDKKIHDLIFDETPYKVYSAKVTGTATIKHIPFEEGDNNRVYKGEGSIQFTCYWPFARCRFKTLDEAKEIDIYEDLTEEEKLSRINEWWSGSRISLGGNFGDIPTHFTKEISGKDSVKKISFDEGRGVSWDKMPENISGILNTKTGLVTDKQGNILNQYVTGDTTLKIPVGATKAETANLNFDCWYV